MDMHIDNFKKQLKTAGLWKLLKTALLMLICGAKEIQNENMIIHGARYGKITLCRGNNVLWIAPSDIECFWSDKFRDNNERSPSDHFFIRTRSGREFEVSQSSWYKVMDGKDSVQFKENR